MKPYTPQRNMCNKCAASETKHELPAGWSKTESRYKETVLRSTCLEPTPFTAVPKVFSGCGAACNIKLFLPADDVSVEGRAKIIAFNLHNVLTLEPKPLGWTDLLVGSSLTQHILVINAPKQTWNICPVFSSNCLLALHAAPQLHPVCLLCGDFKASSGNGTLHHYFIEPSEFLAPH